MLNQLSLTMSLIEIAGTLVLLLLSFDQPLLKTYLLWPWLRLLSMLLDLELFDSSQLILIREISLVHLLARSLDAVSRPLLVRDSRRFRPWLCYELGVCRCSSSEPLITHRWGYNSLTEMLQVILYRGTVRSRAHPWRQSRIWIDCDQIFSSLRVFCLVTIEFDCIVPMHFSWWCNSRILYRIHHLIAHMLLIHPCSCILLLLMPSLAIASLSILRATIHLDARSALHSRPNWLKPIILSHGIHIFIFIVPTADHMDIWHVLNWLGVTLLVEVDLSWLLLVYTASFNISLLSIVLLKLVLIIVVDDLILATLR